jgi:predicted RNase H-like HicB family nuclease
MKSRYPIIIESDEAGFSAYAPDFPGCVAAADSKSQVIAILNDALFMHIELMLERGEKIPKQSMVLTITFET